MMGITGKYLNLWRGLLLALGLLATQKMHASHMMGADMQYQYLSNNQYKIIAKVYRDCRGIAFNDPSFSCFAGTNGGNGCGSSALKIARTGIRDITQRCSTN
jgi:hypothetical protein